MSKCVLVLLIRFLFLQEQSLKPVTVTASFYQATRRQTDKNNLETADGSKISLAKVKNGTLRWLGISRNLHKKWGGKFNYGDRIKIKTGNKELDGWWEIHDVMNKRLYNRIDLLVPAGKYGGLLRKVQITEHEQRGAKFR